MIKKLVCIFGATLVSMALHAADVVKPILFTFGSNTDPNKTQDVTFTLNETTSHLTRVNTIATSGISNGTTATYGLKDLEGSETTFFIKSTSASCSGEGGGIQSWGTTTDATTTALAALGVPSTTFCTDPNGRVINGSGANCVIGGFVVGERYTLTLFAGRGNTYGGTGLATLSLSEGATVESAKIIASGGSTNTTTAPAVTSEKGITAYLHGTSAGKTADNWVCCQWEFTATATTVKVNATGSTGGNLNMIRIESTSIATTTTATTLTSDTWDGNTWEPTVENWSTADTLEATMTTAEATPSVTMPSSMALYKLILTGSDPLTLVQPTGEGDTAASIKIIDASATTGAITLPNTSAMNIKAGENTILSEVGTGALTIAEGKKATLKTAWTGTVSNAGTLEYGYAENAVASMAGGTTVYTKGTVEGTTDGVLSPINGGTLTIKEGTYNLATMAFKDIQTTLQMDAGELNFTHAVEGATIDHGFSLGMVNFTMNGGKITTPRFTLSQGNVNRTSNVIQNGGAITVTGTTSTDENTTSIMFGHWNGPTTYTMNSGCFTAEKAYVLVGKTGNNHSWMIGPATASETTSDIATATVKGIYYSNNATGTNTLTVRNGGVLNIGTSGIKCASGKTVNFSIAGGNVAATDDAEMAIPATIGEGGATLSAKTDKAMTVSGALSGTGTLTIGSTDNTGTVVLSATNTYAGGTTVTAGTLNATAENTLGTGAVTVSGGTLNVSAANTTLTGAVTVTGGILNATVANALGSGAVTVSGGMLNATVAGAVNETTSLSITGGTVNLGTNRPKIVAVSGDATLNLVATAAELAAGSLSLPMENITEWPSTVTVNVTAEDGSKLKLGNISCSDNTITFPVSTETPMWTATGENDTWNNEGHWSTGKVPTTGAVIVNFGSNATSLTIDSAVAVTDLKLMGEQGGEIKLSDAASLTATNLTLATNVTLPVSVLTGETAETCTITADKVLTLNVDDEQLQLPKIVANNGTLVLNVTATSTLTFGAETAIKSLVVTGSGNATLNADTDSTVACESYDFSNATGKTTLAFATGSATVKAGTDTILSGTGIGALTIAADKKATLKTAWTGAVNNAGTIEYAYAVSSEIASVAGTTKIYSAGTVGETGVTLNPNGGGTLKLTGSDTNTIYHLSTINNNTTRTTLSMEKACIKFPETSTTGYDCLSLNNADFTMNSGRLEAVRFLVGRGSSDTEAASVTQNAGDIIISGNNNTDSVSGADAASAVIGFWSRNTNYSLNGGTFTAENAKMMMSRQGKTVTWTIGPESTDTTSATSPAVATVKGVYCISGDATKNTLKVRNGGTLNMGSDGIKCASGAGVTFTLEGGNVAATDDAEIAVPSTIGVGNTTLSAKTAKTMTVSGALSGTGALTIGSTDNTGTVKFGASALSSYTGVMTLVAGTTDLQEATISAETPTSIAMQGGTLILGDTAKNLKFTDLTSGKVIILTAETTLSFTVPDGTDLANVTFTVNGKSCKPTVDGTTMTVTAEIAEAPYTATVTENTTFSALVWKGANDVIAPLSAVIAETTTTPTLTTTGATDAVTVTMDTTSTFDKLTITASDVAPLTLAKTGSNKLVVTKVLLTSNLTVNDGVATFTAIDIADGKTIILENTSEMNLPALSGAGSYTKTGTGKLKVSTTNKVEPEIIVSGGTLEFGALTFGEAYNIRAKSGAIIQVGTWTGSLTSTASLFTFEAGSELRMNNGNNASGSTFAAKIVLDAKEGTVKLKGSSSGDNTVISGAISGEGTLELANDSSGNKYTISGAISGDVKVEMNDSGNTVTLTGTNTSTGGTVINSALTAKAASIGPGDLTVKSGVTLTISDNNAVAIASGKTLAGTGTINGNVAIAERATLDASAGPLTVQSPKTLTLNGTVTTTLPEETSVETYLIKCGSTSAEGALMFQQTSDFSVSPQTDGYQLATPPSIIVPEDIKLSDEVKKEIKDVATANGMTDDVKLNGKTSEGTVKDGMLDCFEGDTTVTADPDTTKNTVYLTYDFGIAAVTTETVTAKVQGAGNASAAFKNGVTVKLYAQDFNDATVPVEVEGLTSDKSAIAKGIIKLSGTIPTNKKLTVKVVTAETSTETE